MSCQRPYVVYRRDTEEGDVLDEELSKRLARRGGYLVAKGGIECKLEF